MENCVLFLNRSWFPSDLNPWINSSRLLKTLPWKYRERLLKVADNFRNRAEFCLQEFGDHFQHLSKKKKWNDRYDKTFICIDLGFDEINVIQRNFLVIQFLLKLRLKGHPVYDYYKTIILKNSFLELLRIDPPYSDHSW